MNEESDSAEPTKKHGALRRAVRRTEELTNKARRAMNWSKDKKAVTSALRERHPDQRHRRDDTPVARHARTQ